MERYYYIYILQSQLNNRYYIGSTNNIERRLKDHNSGKVFSTKPFIPWMLKYQEGFKSLAEARQREFQIKSWKKRLAIEKLINASIV